MPAIKVGEEIVTNMFNPGAHGGVIKRAARQAEAELLLGSHSSKRELKYKLAQAFDSARQQGSSMPIEDLERLIDCLAIGKFTDVELQDRTIGKLRPESLVELLDASEWTDAVRKREPLQTKASKRDEIFGLTFGHLIKADPASFQIFDRYFLEKLVGRKPGAVHWLVEQLSQRRVKRLVVWSNLEEAGQMSPSGCREKLSGMICELNDLLEKNHFAGHLEIRVFWEFFHNRYIVTQFDEGSFAFQLPAGVDTFQRDVDNEAQVNSVIPGWKWDSLLRDLVLDLYPHPQELRKIDFEGVTSQNLQVFGHEKWA